MRTKITLLSLLLMSLFFLPLVSAEGFSVDVTPIKDVTTEVQYAIFDVTINNDGQHGRFEIFTLNQDLIFAGEVIDVPTHESRTKRIKIHPQIDKTSTYIVTIFVKSQVTEEVVSAEARIKLISIIDAIRFSVEPKQLKVIDKEIVFVIRNAAETSVNDIRIEATSEIFDKTVELSLDSQEQRRITIPVDLSKAEGGLQNVNVKVFVGGKEAFEKEVPYNLEEILAFDQSKSITGFLVKQKKYTFVNEGNTREQVVVEETSTMLEKLFSYFSESPTFTTEGSVIKTNWDVEVAPYTTEEIVIKTNYLLPLVLLAMIIVGFAFTVNYQSRGVVITKTASKAKSNKGTALKIAIRVKNRKDAIRDVRVRDHLPRHLKVYNKFDFKKPDKIGGNFVEWHLPLLQGGEERVFTYYAYTEDSEHGAFILPQTAVHYLTLHRDPKTEHGTSLKIEVVPKNVVKKD